MMNEEETKQAIQTVNKCLNPLCLYKTKDIVNELLSRDSVEWTRIAKGDQFSYQIAHEIVDYTNHMPETILIQVDVVAAEKDV